MKSRVKRFDTEKISSLSLTGRSREAEGKSKMTPENRTTIQHLFVERLNSFYLNASEHFTRNSKVNLHMKNAFVNIRRTAKPTASHTTMDEQ